MPFNPANPFNDPLPPELQIFLPWSSPHIYKIIDYKLRLLVEHYGEEWPVKEGDAWRRVLEGVLGDYVRGFQYSPRGRDSTRESLEARHARAKLLGIVIRIKTKERRSETAICKDLIGIKRKLLPEYFRKRLKLSEHTLRAELTLARKDECKIKVKS